MNEPIGTLEHNLRAAARTDYTRWVYYRFQKVHMLEITDEPDPVLLRSIYVEPRVDVNDLDEAEMAKPEEVKDEKSPGQEVWDAVAENPMLLISGRPGSGKTTLVSRLVLELAEVAGITELGQRLSSNHRLVPIPLTLRKYAFEQIDGLDALLARWWAIAEEDARPEPEADHTTRDPLSKRYTVVLDVPRLRASIEQEVYADEAGRPALLLFDGIDEVGGPETRKRVYAMALEARRRGFRVLVTGRPGGFAGLDLADATQGHVLPSAPLLYLQPFAWPQILEFTKRWYGLREEWKRKRKTGLANFLEALQDHNRPFLLSLARRPIFLTLTALVHLTRNVMPDGRATLYQQITELYLVRQDRHRQLKQSADGTELGHWPDTEKRLVLGYLAWLSQCRGSQAADKVYAKRDQARQLIWSKKELLDAIRDQLNGGRFGRFSVLGPHDAEALLAYFLHPAGLLVAPERDRIQFAHLSFQEYLCAEFLQGRATLKNADYLQNELIGKLTLPGWDEVAILFLTVQAEKTQNEGHFEILETLDLSNPQQAGLLVNSLAGGELPFNEREQETWLPRAIAAALVHPGMNFTERLLRRASLGRRLRCWVTDLTATGNPEEAWGLLARHLPAAEAMTERWLAPKNSASWDVYFSPLEAQTAALLQLVRAAAAESTDLIKVWEKGLLTWMQRAHLREPHLFIGDSPGEVTTAFSWLESLLRPGSSLAAFQQRQTHLETFMLCEGLDDEYFFAMNPAPVSMVFALYPKTTLHGKDPLLALLYGFSYLVSSISHRLIEEKIRALAPALARAQAQAQARAPALARARAPARAPALARAQARAPARALARARARALALRGVAAYGRDPSFAELIGKAAGKLDSGKHAQPSLVEACSLFAYRFVALDWFDEMASEKGLAHSRGLKANEPLPLELGLLDKTGRLHPSVTRDQLVRMAAFLKDDDRVLAWAYRACPNVLSTDLNDLLHKELADLKQRPWSPHAGLASVLEDWPANEAQRPLTLASAEADLLRELKRFLADN